MFAPAVDHELNRELREVDAVLAAHPEWERWVHADLTRGVAADLGRDGMPASRVLRVHVLLKRLNIPLRRFAPLLADSLSLREFIGLGLADRAPKRSTLQENLQKVVPETWGKLLEGLARSVEARAHETGEKARVDATVTATNIHPPSDSSLLWDCTRVLTRLMREASDLFAVEFLDLSKAAKKLHHGIFYARTKAQREPAYGKFLEVAGKVRGEAKTVVEALRGLEPSAWKDLAMRDGLVSELEQYQAFFARVIDQTQRRVLRGETVPAREKIFSVFEPQTDIIVKNGNRPAEYGHKLTLTVGKSGMVLDCVIERGNPGDVTLATRQIERQKALFGRAPATIVFDGAYASKENLDQAKALGVERCAFSKGRGLTAEEMAGSRRTYGRLRNFRAGIEATVSYLKRSFGLDCCTWKGWARFQSYVWSAVFAANLTILARRRLCET